jgi:hypothetical protein
LITGLKRFIRREVVISVAAHASLLGLVLVSANGTPPVPPEAMTVEIVPSSEAPQIENNNNIDGTTLESTSNGSEVSSASEKGSTSTRRPQPKAKLPSLQQTQSRVNAKRNSNRAAAEPQAASPAEPETQPQASEPLLPPTTPTDEPQPHPKEAASQTDAQDMFAMPLTLPGGRLGGGFDTPTSAPAMLPHDDIAAFKARLSSCSRLPPGIDRDVAIALRISFKRDGTLASPPQLLDASLSPDAATLMTTAINALERCQPFTELPADKYKKWRTLNLIVTPLALSSD